MLRELGRMLGDIRMLKELHNAVLSSGETYFGQYLSANSLPQFQLVEYLISTSGEIIIARNDVLCKDVMALRMYLDSNYDVRDLAVTIQ